MHRDKGKSHRQNTDLLDKLIAHTAQMICAREKHCESLLSGFTTKQPLRSDSCTLRLSPALSLSLHQAVTARISSAVMEGRSPASGSNPPPRRQQAAGQPCCAGRVSDWSVLSASGIWAGGVGDECCGCRWSHLFCSANNSSPAVSWVCSARRHRYWLGPPHSPAVPPVSQSCACTQARELKSEEDAAQQATWVQGGLDESSKVAQGCTQAHQEQHRLSPSNAGDTASHCTRRCCLGVVPGGTAHPTAAPGVPPA